MKNLIMAVALTTAFMGASVAVAEDASQGLSFEDAEKMEQMSEQDKQQKGAGVVSWVAKGYQAWQKMSKLKKTGTVIGVGSNASDIYDGTKAVSGYLQGRNSNSSYPHPPLTGAGSTMPPPTNFHH